MSIVCIIPARGGSKGIHKKNIKDFIGYPLVSHTIAHALHSSIFDKVIVDTDDESIAEIAKKYGAEVPYLRPKHLGGDRVSSEDVILNSLVTMERKLNFYPKTVVMLQATSPIRSKETIKRAYKRFVQTNSDSLTVVSERSHFLWKGFDKSKPTFDIKNRKLRQDLSEEDLFFEEHGSMYVFDKKGFQLNKCRLFGNIHIYIANKWEAVDIDNEEDWMLAEMTLDFLLKSSKKEDYDYQKFLD